jgi:hypothetical protein
MSISESSLCWSIVVIQINYMDSRRWVSPRTGCIYQNNYYPVSTENPRSVSKPSIRNIVLSFLDYFASKIYLKKPSSFLKEFHDSQSANLLNLSAQNSQKLTLAPFPTPNYLFLALLSSLFNFSTIPNNEVTCSPQIFSCFSSSPRLLHYSIRNSPLVSSSSF